MRIWVLSREPLKRRHGIYCVPGTGDSEGTLPDQLFLPSPRRDFFAGLDFLLLAMPLTTETRWIIGPEDLAVLPRSASILNPARGLLINEHALLGALRNRRIKGAVLDTHYYYPLPADHLLWGMDNVILTPHISGSAGKAPAIDRIWELLVDNVRRFLAGGQLLNEVPLHELEKAKGNRKLNTCHPTLFWRWLLAKLRCLATARARLDCLCQGST